MFKNNLVFFFSFINLAIEYDCYKIDSINQVQKRRALSSPFINPKSQTQLDYDNHHTNQYNYQLADKNILNFCRHTHHQYDLLLAKTYQLPHLALGIPLRLLSMRDPSCHQ